MPTNAAAALALAVSLSAASAPFASWPAPVARAVPGASGFVVIPGAKVPFEPGRIYKTVYDATRAAAKPDEILPALDMAGSELNGMDACRLPLANMKVTVVFHGDALDGLLDDAHYRARFGVANPNLAVLASMKRLGAKLYVCGQNLAFAHVDPSTLTPDVEVAADALVVLMTYQNSGWALLSF